jgi:hypothetical protein
VSIWRDHCLHQERPFSFYLDTDRENSLESHFASTHTHACSVWDWNAE